MEGSTEYIGQGKTKISFYIHTFVCIVCFPL